MAIYKFIIEKSLTKRGCYEVWKKNRKGYYNFIQYLKEEDLPKFKKENKKHEIIDKTLL